MKTLFTSIGFAVLTCSLFSQEINVGRLDRFFDSLETNQKVMGSFAIAKNGKNIYTRSVGFSSIDSSRKLSATKETLYRIGSVSKTFTATIIFQLIEEGEISLQTTIDEYFPQIAGSKKITVDMLLRHRSGLYNYVNNPQDPEWIMRPQTRDSIIAMISNTKANFPPNDKVIYNNSGYFLLVCMIEKITGLSYNENLQQRICKKLKLTNTVSPSDNDHKDNEALPYRLINNGWVLIKDNYFPNIVGVGDILSTPSDLQIFIDALLDGKLTSQKSLAIMKDSRGNGNRVFGRGIMKVNYNKVSGFGHRGDTFGSHTTVLQIAEESLTFSSCINGNVGDFRDINIAALNAIEGMTK